MTASFILGCSCCSGGSSTPAFLALMVRQWQAATEADKPFWAGASAFALGIILVAERAS